MLGEAELPVDRHCPSHTVGLRGDRIEAVEGVRFIDRGTQLLREIKPSTPVSSQSPMAWTVEPPGIDRTTGAEIVAMPFATALNVTATRSTPAISNEPEESGVPEWADR